jgi:hypothetical protein
VLDSLGRFVGRFEADETDAALGDQPHVGDGVQGKVGAELVLRNRGRQIPHEYP